MSESLLHDRCSFNSHCPLPLPLPLPLCKNVKEKKNTLIKKQTEHVQHSTIAQYAKYTLILIIRSYLQVSCVIDYYYLLRTTYIIMEKASDGWPYKSSWNSSLLCCLCIVLRSSKCCLCICYDLMMSLCCVMILVLSLYFVFLGNYVWTLDWRKRIWIKCVIGLWLINYLQWCLINVWIKQIYFHKRYF